MGDSSVSCCSLLVSLLLLGGCGQLSAPPCPLVLSTSSRLPEHSAPSAGCLAKRNGALLVVESLDGKLSPPGGSAETGEDARCTAYRETWEETGLRLQPAELLAVFDTGFHLYYCEHDANSGEIDPPPRMEVRQAFYLAVSEFDNWNWRFPGQENQLTALMTSLKDRADPDTPKPPPTAPETR